MSKKIYVLMFLSVLLLTGCVKSPNKVNNHNVYKPNSKYLKDYNDNIYSKKKREFLKKENYKKSYVKKNKKKQKSYVNIKVNPLFSTKKEVVMKINKKKFNEFSIKQKDLSNEI